MTKPRSSLLVGGLAASLLLSPVAGAQGIPADHPPIPPGTSASPTTAPARPDTTGLPLPSGHPSVTEGAQAMSTDALIEKLDATPDLLERPKTFEMSAMIGRLYLHRGRHPEARKFLGQAVEKGAGLEKSFLSHGARLPLSEREALSKTRCAVSQEAGLEAQALEVERALKKGERLAASACLGDALPGLVNAYEQLGKAAQLDGDFPAAIAAYEGALRVDGTSAESLFARATLLFETRGEDLKALAIARDGFRFYLQKHPEGPRAAASKELLSRVEGSIQAGGVNAWIAKSRRERLARVGTTFPKAGVPRQLPPAQAATAPAAGELPELTPEMVEAIQNVERTPELEAGLAKLVEEGEEHLAKGRYQEALANYRRVVPVQPDNGRAQAGMAWAMVGLNRGAVADRIWGVAAQNSPEALDALGDALKAKGNAASAKAVWTRLLATSPGYPARAAVEKKLK